MVSRRFSIAFGISIIAHLIILSLPAISFEKSVLILTEVSLLRTSPAVGPLIPPASLKGIERGSGLGQQVLPSAGKPQDLWTPGQGEPCARPARIKEMSPGRKLENHSLEKFRKKEVSGEEGFFRLKGEKLSPTPPSLSGIEREEEQKEWFYVSGMVSQREVLKKIRPEYPLTAREKGITGKVKLQIWVLPEGKIQKIQVLETSGSAILDEAAERAMSQWVFQPLPAGNKQLQNGTIDIIFRLK